MVVGVADPLSVLLKSGWDCLKKFMLNSGYFALACYEGKFPLVYVPNAQNAEEAKNKVQDKIGMALSMNPKRDSNAPVLFVVYSFEKNELEISFEKNGQTKKIKNIDEVDPTLRRGYIQGLMKSIKILRESISRENFEILLEYAGIKTKIQSENKKARRAFADYLEISEAQLEEIFPKKT